MLRPNRVKDKAAGLPGTTGSRHLERCRVNVSLKIVDAMRAIDEGGVEIAMVLDEQERLVGTITDGDVRRALLRGDSLDSPLANIMHAPFVAVSGSAGRAEVLDLMRARSIAAIPIIDSDRRLTGLHLLREIIGRIERPNWAVVMAGGRGTRLGSMTETTPKPMLRVAGRPILERIVLHLVGFGISRIFLSINYLGHIIEDYFGDGSEFGCHISYLRENRPLGTGGALSLLPESPVDPVLVMNGDLVTQVDLASMLAFHAQGPQKLTIGVRQYVHTVPFGCITMAGPRVVQIEEKPRLEKVVNAGIYLLDPDLVAKVPKDFEFSLPSLIEECLSDGIPVGGFEIEDDWTDIGQREQLKAARIGG